MHFRPYSLLLGCILLSLLALQVVARRDKPEVVDTAFDGTPGNIFYFEDSDVVLVSDLKSANVKRSTDGGATWKNVEDVKEGEAAALLKHQYDEKLAIILGKSRRHWITRDRGESWDSFETDDYVLDSASISFHAEDADRILLHTRTHVYYTTDGFKSDPKLLHQDVYMCIWAKSSDIFTTGDKDLDKDTILCIAPGEFDASMSSTRVLVSSDYFKTSTEPLMSDGKPVQGVTNLASAKRYIVFAAKSGRTDEMALQVTTDTKTWHRAEIGEHRLEEGAYTLLESTNYSMQLDVMNTMMPVGTLLTSESNGTFFSKTIEHTNRNEAGYVDFEKIANIQGIVLVNVIDNWEDFEHRGSKKKLKSKISFDDGRTWSPLRVDKDDLHLHSVTEQNNIGRIFSSPAPGVVMGIGNTGDYLDDYRDGDLYVSHDAGLSWSLALKKPHVYEFGASGSVLLAIENDETNEISWSLDYGQNWDKMTLEDTIKPVVLTTTPDSTSLKFLMLAERKGKGLYFYSIDFDGLHERECKDGDLEKWSARVYDDEKPQCIMGHTQTFLRRKLDADCLVTAEHFEDPKMETEDCPCSELDFECDYNFIREGEDCVPVAALVAPSGACKDEDDTFEGPSGYRLIPGNTCSRSRGVDIDKKTKEWSCNNSKKAPLSDQDAPDTTVSTFKDADEFWEFFYLERGDSNSGEDETIVAHADNGDVWLTKDHGKKWEKIKENVKALYPHQYKNEMFYMITSSATVYYSTNRGRTIREFDAPSKPDNRARLLQFHPLQSDWLIWNDIKECDAETRECMADAHISRHSGEGWTPLLTSIRNCQFVYSETRKDMEDLVYCERYDGDSTSSSVSLLSSKDGFDHKTTLKENVIRFATMSEYIIVALQEEGSEDLKVDASVDGVNFADAKFPPNFKVPHQQAYTVLDSSTHAIFLHVTVESRRDREYGSIIKSNSNGTSYVLSVSEVNRNVLGYVDFEKVSGLEGVAVINRVDNAKDSGYKKLKTYITHNDGAAWGLLSRPEDPPKDLGDSYKCKGSDTKCSLHLHGYTERIDPRDSFSSPSAIGILIGTGNVGEYLTSKKEADTFMSTDAGITWKFVRKGLWMWEFGDQGSVIVIVKEREATNSVLYTLDEGATWRQHKFTASEMEVTSISTVPSDTSLNFLLRGKIDGDLTTVNLDFSVLTERSKQCDLDEKNPGSSKSDYFMWTPKHPLRKDDCLFGHVAQYHRKRTDRDCFNGREIARLHSITSNCTCEREDFECDYNYEPGSNGECKLVQGLSKPDPAAVCAKDPDLMEYNDITGYRRIPLSTCSGGKELDYTLKKSPCPGHKADFDKAHSLSGAGLFFAITLPIAAAAGIGYWIYQRWDGKFGRIRLGENSSSTTQFIFFDRDAPWIRFPVLALSGIVAVIAAVPMVVSSLWRVVSTRLGRSNGRGIGGMGGIGGGGGGAGRPFTSRSSFQRGRGNYSVIDPDEGELLGEDSDEEV